MKHFKLVIALLWFLTALLNLLNFLSKHRSIDALFASMDLALCAAYATLFRKDQLEQSAAKK